MEESEDARRVGGQEETGQVVTMRNTDVTDVIERVTELMHEQTQSQEDEHKKQKISSKGKRKRERLGPRSRKQSSDPLEQQQE